MIALIAISSAVFAMDKPYSYRVPETMDLHPGMRVLVPFGAGNRRVEGMALSITNGSEEALKCIETILDPEPILSKLEIRMAAFVRERYFCTFYDALKVILPAGVWYAPTEIYHLAEDTSGYRETIKRQPDALAVMEHLEALGGSARWPQLQEVIPEEEKLTRAISYLQKKHYLIADRQFSKRLREKTEKIVALAVPAEEAMEFAEKRRRTAPMQHEILKLLCMIGSSSTKEICYFTGASSDTIKRLERLGYVNLTSRLVEPTLAPIAPNRAEPYALNPAQQEVYENLQQQAQGEHPGISLLYGVTGSGKTAVYIQLIRAVIAQNRSAMLLVPEIALTPQLVELLTSHFGEDVAVLHSGLRITQRYEAWKKIRAGKVHVVVGTRSAVFAPVPNLGLIILDEEQDHAYKSENSPRYHAREIAIYRGSKERALVLLGSATPSLESMYHALRGDYSLNRLSQRYNGKTLPTVEMVDLKEEIRRGNSSSLSLPLQEELRSAIDHGRQSILFLNRRGAGRCLICVECGEVPGCSRCSAHLTYHAANRRLMCHYCGQSIPLPDRCPKCGGRLKPVGLGTQKIEQDLEKSFPGVSVLRMDADTISASNRHADILRKFREDKIPILVGTQMVTKGLDFENVTLVGVIDADMSLYVDHFRAAETTFSMLTQVIGRAGRGTYTGKAMVQTMTPEHTVMKLAAAQDYDGFYRQEIALRDLHRCPPFGDLMVVCFMGEMEPQVVANAAMFRDAFLCSLGALEYSGIPIHTYGPIPSVVAKVNRVYRYRLTISCTNQKSIRLLLANLLRNHMRDKRSKGISAYIDSNPYE